MLGQASRIREGLPAIAGNHVVISIGLAGPFVWLAHLREGSVRVRVGDEVTTGEQVGECGNSGNSTQPHVHVQATDSLTWETARGLPVVFRSYRHVVDGFRVEEGVPDESEVIEMI